jgi:hypothetical protein
VRGAWLLLALALAGCAEPPPEPEPSMGELPDIGPLDALARRLGRLQRRLENRGYGSAMSTTRFFALEGRGVALPFDLPRGRCTTLVTLGGGAIRDLELTLYDSDGREAAIDGAPGEAGLVHVCPSEAGAGPIAPHYLVARSLVGDGAVVLAAFVNPPEEGEGFDGLFEGVLAPVAPFFDAEEALAGVRASMRERGLRPESEPVFATLAEGQARRVPVSLEAGRCYVVAARSGEGVADLDLFLYDEGGAEVARDLGGDARPRIEHCPPQGGRGTLELRVFEGAGAVGWVIWSGPGPQQQPPPDTDDPAPTTPTDEPFAALATAAASLVARGYGEPIFLVRDGPIAPGESRTHEVAFAAGCTLVIGAAGPGEVDLDLYLATEDGIVDRDTRVRRSATVAACGSQGLTRRITVKAYGRGQYALALLGAPAEVDDLAELRAEASRAALEQRGYRLIREQRLEGEAIEEPMTVPAGCVGYVVAGGEGVGDVDLLLRNDDGRLLTADTGPEPWASLERCDEDDPLSAGTARLEIVPFTGEGSVLLLHFVR